MALGRLAEKEEICQGKQSAAYWAKPAFSMIPIIMMQDGLTAVHCLILFRYHDIPSIYIPTYISLYHMWVLNPAHAYNMICIASEKMQKIVEKYFLLSQLSHSYRQLESPQELLSPTMKITWEMETRAYWIIYIIDKCQGF